MVEMGENSYADLWVSLLDTLVTGGLTFAGVTASWMWLVPAAGSAVIAYRQWRLTLAHYTRPPPR